MQRILLLPRPLLLNLFPNVAKCITSQRTICAISLSMMIFIDSSCMAKVAPLRGRRARVPTAASDAHD